mgnify:CR=1 FL=1
MEGPNQKYYWVAILVAAIVLLGVIFQVLGQILNLATASWIPWWGKYVIGAIVILFGIKVVKGMRR